MSFAFRDAKELVELLASRDAELLVDMTGMRFDRSLGYSQFSGNGALGLVPGPSKMTGSCPRRCFADVLPDGGLSAAFSMPLDVPVGCPSKRPSKKAARRRQSLARCRAASIVSVRLRSSALALACAVLLCNLTARSRTVYGLYSARPASLPPRIARAMLYGWLQSPMA